MAVDLAGFTSLTDRLSPWGSRGTEGLSRVLRRYFAGVTDVVVAAGGDPVAFGGDSLSMVFDGPPGPTVDAALVAAARVQDLTAGVEGIDTPTGPLEVRVRVGVARGAVATAVARAGGRLLPVQVGPGLDLAHAAQEEAAVGSVAADASATSVRDTKGPVAVPSGPVVPAPSVDVDRLLPAALLDRLRHDRTLGESHRTVTVVFVRYPAVRPDAVLPFLGRVATLMDLVHASGGEVVQVSGGDKGILAMVVLGAPVAHPDDAARAVHAMADLQRHELQAAVGIATGPVFAAVLGSRSRLFPTHTGLAVNVAARLSQRAAAGSMLVDDRTWQQASRHLRQAGPPARHSLKGCGAPVVVHRVAGWRRARARPTSAALPLLVGRDAEVARIEGLLDAVATGRGGALAIQGPPGIGKTRIVQEVVIRARTRGFVPVSVDVADHLRGQGPQVWRDVVGGLIGVSARASLRAWQDALSAALPDVPDPGQVLGPLLGLGGEATGRPLDPDTGRLAPELAQTALGRLLRNGSRHAPTLLVIEGTDRLDAASADLLHAMATAAAGCAAGVVVTAGTEAAAAPYDDTIVLAPLDHDRTGLLAEEAWRQAGGGTPPAWLAGTVGSRAGGNPLAARLTAQDLLTRWRPGDPPPPAADATFGAVAGLLASQIDRLPADARELLTVLAVAQRPCGPRLLTHLLSAGGTVSSVRRRASHLVAERIVTQSDGDPEETYAVSHDLLRRAVYESTSHVQRERLHRALVERLAVPGADPVEIALHVHPLGDQGLARRWFPRAARAARHSWDLAGAQQWLERLLPLVEDGDRALVEIELLEVLLVAGRATDVVERLGRAPSTPALGDGLANARRLHVLAEAEYACGKFRRAEKTAARVMQLVDGVDEPRYHRAGELLVLSRCEQGELDDALLDGRELAERAADAPDPTTRATAQSALAVALVLAGSPEAAADHYRSALVAATEAHDAVRQVHVISDLAGCAYLLGDFRESLQRLAQARQLADAIGYLRHLALSLDNEAQLRAALGDPYATPCASAAVRRSLELGDLATAADALHSWVTAKPGLAVDPGVWRRLVAIERRLGRLAQAAGASADLAVALSRTGDVARAHDAAAEAEDLLARPTAPVVRRATFAKLLADTRDPTRRSRSVRDHALAGLDRLAEDPDLDEREAAEIALERWRLCRDPGARECAENLLGLAFEAEPSAVVRSWFRLMGEPAPDPPVALPPPVGIARSRTTRRDLEAAFADVEAAVAAAAEPASDLRSE